MKEERVILVCQQERVTTSEDSSIEYAPAGVHTVYATVDGEPRKVTVRVDEDLAGLLQSMLQERLDRAEDGEASRPYVDFDHDGKAAAGIPKRFFWKDGIRLEVDWTESGKSSIEGRDYSYFSPELIINSETGDILGIPATGAIGALVNAPAFQTIERLAAAANQYQSQHTNIMEKELQEKLVAAEAKAADHEKQIGELRNTVDELKEERDSLLEAKEASEKEISDLESKVAEFRKAKIEKAIEAKGVKDEHKESLLKACLKQDDDGEALLAAFEAPEPKGHKPLSKDRKKDEEDLHGLSKLTAGIGKKLQLQTA